MLYSGCGPEAMFSRQRRMKSENFFDHLYIIWGGSGCVKGGIFVKFPKVTTLVATLLDSAASNYPIVRQFCVQLSNGLTVLCPTVQWSDSAVSNCPTVQLCPTLSNCVQLSNCPTVT